MDKYIIDEGDIHKDGFVFAHCRTRADAAAIVHAMQTLPVLVAALEGLEAAYDESQPFVGDKQHARDIADAWDSARTALARARGEG